VEEINALLQGFGVALSPLNLLLMFVGVILGIIIGVLPGLGGANGVAILLPLTFSMAQQPGGTTSAIILLSCIYWGALFGGAITSILFNIPGEPWSVATTFDGHPLAQQGRAGSCADRGVYLLVHRGADRGDHDHVSIPRGGGFRPPVRPAGILLGISADLLRLCRHERRQRREDRCLHDDRVRTGCRRPGQRHRHLAAHVRITSLLKGFDFLIAVIGLFGIGEILETLEEGLAFKGASAKINARVVLKPGKNCRVTGRRLCAAPR